MIILGLLSVSAGFVVAHEQGVLTHEMVIPVETVVENQPVVTQDPVSKDYVVGKVAGLSYADKTLANGMRIVAVAQPDVKGRAVVELVFKGVGASIEKVGQTGLAHLIEHMLFKGANEGLYDAVVSRYGGYTNAFTAFDVTAYYVSLDSANWQPIVKLLAQSLAHKEINPQYLASEVKVVVKELRRDDENLVWTWFKKIFQTTFPSNHPHYGCIIGDRKDLADLTAEKLEAFLKTYYHPDVATLFIVGDINPEEVVQAAAEEMNHLPSGNVQLPNRFAESYEIKKGFHEVVHDEVQTNTVTMMWHLPGGDKKSEYAAHMLSGVLAKNDSSPLKKVLVHEKKLVSSVDCDCWMNLGNGYFILSMSPFDGKLDEAVQVVHEEFKKVLDAGVDASTLEKLVLFDRMGQAQALETITAGKGGINPDWISRYARYGTLEDCFAYVDQLTSVTSGDIQNLIATYLSEQDVMRVDIVPMTDAAREEKAKKIAEQQALEEVIFANHQRTIPVVAAQIPEMYPEALPVQPKFLDSRTISTLENGLTIVTSQNTSSSLCSFVLRHKQAEFIDGTVDDALLAILGQLLVEGSAGMTKDEIIGWFYDRSIAFDAFSLTGLQDKVLPGIQKLFEVVFSANFAADDLEKLKALAKERIMSSQTEVRDLADRITGQVVYQKTPRAYDWDTLISRIDGLSVDGVKRLFIEYCDPSKMLVVFVGNCMHDDVVNVVREATRDWSPGLGKDYAFAVEAPNGQESLFVDKQILKDQVWVQFVRPSMVTATSSDIFTMSVLSSVVKKRAFRLREESGLFYVAHGALAHHAKASVPGFDLVLAQTGTELLDKASDLFDRFFSVDLQQPISDAELSSAKSIAKSEFVSKYAGIAGELKFCTNLTCNGVDVDFYTKGMGLIDALTPETATQLLQAYVNTGPFTRIRVGNLTPPVAALTMLESSSEQSA